MDDIAGLTVAGRYVRMYGTQRSTTGSGYSLWEFEIYDETTPTATPVPPTATYYAYRHAHSADGNIYAYRHANPDGDVTPTATSIPPTATYTPTATPIPPTATFAPTATSVPPTATFTPTTCTPVNLTKGPTLIYGGVNTEMRVVWQWTATQPSSYAGALTPPTTWKCQCDAG